MVAIFPQISFSVSFAIRESISLGRNQTLYQVSLKKLFPKSEELE